MIERPDLDEWCVVESENHVPHICRANVQDVRENVHTAVDYNQVVDTRLLFAKDHLVVIVRFGRLKEYLERCIFM